MQVWTLSSSPIPRFTFGFVCLLSFFLGPKKRKSLANICTERRACGHLLQSDLGNFRAQSNSFPSSSLPPFDDSGGAPLIKPILLGVSGDGVRGYACWWRLGPSMTAVIAFLMEMRECLLPLSLCALGVRLGDDALLFALDLVLVTALRRGDGRIATGSSVCAISSSSSSLIIAPCLLDGVDRQTRVRA